MRIANKGTYLKEDVCTVVHDQDEGADAVQIAHPAERQQQQRDYVVDEHLPEVLALDVEELGEGQRPVEGHRDHVIPPDVVLDRLF